MKNFKIIFTYPYLYITIFVLFMSNCMYAQTLSINPSEQSIALESGQQISTNVTLLNQSSQYPINYKIRLWDSSSQGLIGVNPALDQNLSLAQNAFQHYSFTFSLNTTNNQTRTYKFRVDWMIQNGLNIEATSYITINVTFLAPICNLSPPTSLFTGNILSSTAVASWDSVPGASAYNVKYTDDSPPSPSSVVTSDNYLWMSVFNPNTTHYWQVRTKCPNGASSSWSQPVYFTTLPECPTNVELNLPIRRPSLITASNTITASAIVLDKNTGSDVTLKATQIILKDGFSVSGYEHGVFTAVVDPCSSGSKTKSEKENRLSPEFTKQENKILPILSPNPTSTFLNVENIGDINEWKLVDINGKIIDSGRVNSSIQSKITINTSTLIPGIYYFNAVMKNGELFQKTVMKK